MNSESSVFILSLLPQLVPVARITSRQPGVEGYYWRTFFTGFREALFRAKRGTARNIIRRLLFGAKGSEAKQGTIFLFLFFLLIYASIQREVNG